MYVYGHGSLFLILMSSANNFRIADLEESMDAHSMMVQSWRSV